MSGTVRTDLTGANACCIEVTERAGRDVVRFAADPHAGTEALWFRLRVEGCAGRPVELTLTNPDTCLGFGRGTPTRPGLRMAGGDWERVAAPETRDLPDGRHEAAWVVEPTTDAFDFAFCYPYLPEDLADTLECCAGYWRPDAIGVSQKGRPFPRVSNSAGQEGAGMPGIYLLARQHSGETPGSRVLDGVLRRAKETVDPEALLLRAAPFANLDGVLDGDYGKNPFPYDLNRAWTRPPMRHEVLVMQQDMARWSRRCRPALVVDLHGPGASEAEGVYFHLPRPSRPQAEVATSRTAVLTLREHLPADLMRQAPDIQAAYPSRRGDDHILKDRPWWEEHFVHRLQDTPERFLGSPVLAGDRFVPFNRGGREYLVEDRREHLYGLFRGSLPGQIRGWLGLDGTVKTTAGVYHD